jgi:hypothetical protein
MKSVPPPTRTSSSRAPKTIKNEVIFVTLDEYFRERVRPWNGALKKLQDKALERPPLSSLHPRPVSPWPYPDSKLGSRTDSYSRVQNERNDKESFCSKHSWKRAHGRSQQDFLEKEKGPPNCPGRGKSYPGECPVEAAQIRSLAEINGTSLLKP